MNITRSNTLRHSVQFAIISIFTLISILFTSALIYQPTQALSGSSFNAGRIIDDAVFYNNSSMSATQVQSFLNSKVPTCDTYGQRISEFGGPDLNGDGKVQRWEWGKANYNQTTFPCLKDYKQNTPQMGAASSLCEAMSARTAQTSAQIISAVAKACGINPQVLIVLLNKEQSLVVDTWPLTQQYNSATGFDCPDNAPCDPAYAGFFYQVYHAARQFKVYKAYPTSYNYIAGRTNNVYWHPDLSRCGSSSVFIQNQATAALYIYTPYRPNTAALNNLYGTGDSCSSYGNRNFWRMFSEWFGSTTAVNGHITLSKNLTINKSTSSVYVGDTLTASYEVSNDSSYSFAAGGFGICARLNGQWYDFGFIHNNQIDAKGKKTISFSKKITTPGKLEIFTCSYNTKLGGWASDIYPYNGAGDIRSLVVNAKDNPLLETGVTLSNSAPYAGEELTATFTIKNNSSSSVNIGRMVLSARGPDGSNVDFPSDTTGAVIPAGGTYTFSKSKSFAVAGDYTYRLMNRDASGWSSTYPKSKSTTTIRSGKFTVKENPLITSNLVMSPTYPVAGEPVTATVTIKNLSNKSIDIGRPVISVRDTLNTNNDFPSSNTSIGAGQTLTYTQTRIFTKPGEYSFNLVNNYNGAWISGYPKKNSPDLQTSGKLYVASNPSITSFSVSKTPISETMSTITATTIIRNTSSSPIDIGRIVYAMRDSKGNNLDLPSSSVTVAAGSTYTYTQQRSVYSNEVYTIEINNKKDGVWSKNYPSSLFNISRSKTIK